MAQREEETKTDKAKRRSRHRQISDTGRHTDKHREQCRETKGQMERQEKGEGQSNRGIQTETQRQKDRQTDLRAIKRHRKIHKTDKKSKH